MIIEQVCFHVFLSIQSCSGLINTAFMQKYNYLSGKHSLTIDFFVFKVKQNFSSIFCVSTSIRNKSTAKFDYIENCGSELSNRNKINLFFAECHVTRW